MKIESDHYFIIKENKWIENSPIESILFEAKNECVDEIPIHCTDFFELYKEVNGDWILIEKNK